KPVRSRYRARGLRVGPGHRASPQHAQNRLSPRQHARVKITAPEVRHDVALDYRAADRVGQLSFQAVANLDSHLMLARHDDQHRASILALLTDPPLPPELVAVILDRIAAERLERDHHHLFAG